jgi:tRNA(Ile)-lysidine synthase
MMFDESLLGRPGEGRLAVAVSGGVDSIVLLHALRARGHEPSVVHFHHGTRPENEAEWALVEELAGPCFQGHRLALKPGPDLQARARAARYAVLDALPFDCIALGHHADDQAETVLDRLIRGAGAGGLAGIASRRGRYVRPLLGSTRATILAYAEDHGLQWMEDPSNVRGTRGSLRGQVLPALEAIRRGASKNIVRSASSLAADDALLNRLAAELVSEGTIALGPLQSAPAPLARRAVLQLVRGARGGLGGVEARHIDAVIQGRGVQLPHAWCLHIHDGFVRCLPPNPVPAQGTALSWGLWKLASEAPIHVRAPTPGERLAGRSVRERLRAARVPAWARPYHPVVSLGTRRWLVGVYLDRASAPDAGVQVHAERAGSAHTARL